MIYFFTCIWIVLLITCSYNKMLVPVNLKYELWGELFVMQNIMLTYSLGVKSNWRWAESKRQWYINYKGHQLLKVHHYPQDEQS